MKDYDYDYFVIGAGSAGVRSARVAAQHGAKVGIAEKFALGGTCVNLGCVPKKIMAYGADYSMHLADARGYGWDVPQDIGFDWNSLIANQRAEITRLNGIYQNILEKNGVTLHRGAARFGEREGSSLPEA
ncbi:MAG: FAD-dependent oxidoreductase, partial [Bdellovibrionales bacterium]